MRVKFLLTLALLMTLLAAIFPTAQPADAQSGKQVWVFYMGFWTPGGWDHRSNVLTDYPLDRYNSADGGVAGRQIGEAQGAGIDAFLVSWFGPNEGQTTAVLNTMLDQAAGRGFKVGAVIDAFQGEFTGNRDYMISTISYIINDRANHPAYLRYNGKPVIYFAFQENSGLSTADWQAIRAQLDPNHNTIWVAEGVRGCCIHGGAFDGMYAFNVAWGSPASTARSQKAATYNAGGTFYTPTVHPGWDETLIAQLQGRTNPTSPKDPAGGAFLRNSWNGAVAAGTDVILIVSWNEFMENSHIEPSVNYGTQSLDTLRPLIAAWKGGAPVASGAPTGQTVTARTTLNVRAEPSTSGAKLGTIPYNSVYEVLGQQSGWYMISFNGQNGWVFGQYVTVSSGGVAAGSPSTSQFAPGTTILRTRSNLNVRAEPSTSGAKLGTLRFGETHAVLGEQNGWYMIAYNGQNGWVFGRYVTISQAR